MLGTINKYKAKVIVRGNENETQKESVLPVSNFTTTQLLLCPVLKNNWKIRYVHSRDAFRNGKLDREVYAELP